MAPRIGIFVLLLLALAVGSVGENEREEQMKKDRETFEGEGGWVYNDLKRGFKQARKAGKPLFVVIRCVP